MPEQAAPSVEEAPAELRNFSYTEVGGKLFYKENENLTPVEVPAITAERIRGMIGLRDITRDLIEAQLNGRSEDTIADLQQKLNTAYDSFNAKYWRVAGLHRLLPSGMGNQPLRTAGGGVLVDRTGG